MRLNYLDVLKAFAILAVVLYHSGFMSYGYLGVDLFLVINGYLITKSLNKRLMVDGLNSNQLIYLQFEVSRLVRLLPVLLIAGIFCMIVGYFVMLPDDYENLSESVVATNLFGNNILAAITTKNYWDVVNEYKPLMHTWYVGILMQFYIIYPILFFIARLDKNDSQRTLVLMISTLAVISLIVYFGTTDVAQRFYYLPSRFFEFAVGGIVALTWKPEDGEKTFHVWFVFACYALLLLLIAVNRQLLPANLRLVAIVALTVVLLMSSSMLENRVTANVILAKIGAASYSIFVWHQVLLAFYRYTISSYFTVISYTLLLVVVAIFSWITYYFIEQKTNKWMDDIKSKYVFYSIIIALFFGLLCFATHIYIKGGVVRDVPELYISKFDKVNHKGYNEKINQYDRSFVTDKPHWLVVGNSFGRDFSNTILESTISDSIELSYIRIENYKLPLYADRFANADRVFFSSLGIDEQAVTELELICQANGFNVENLVIVGTKNFGTSNGQFYIHRNSPDYYMQRTQMEEGYYERNALLKSIYKERYLDLIGLVIDDNMTVPVFTPDHHFISQDCRHFSKGGAIWFSQLIDWEKYLK